MISHQMDSDYITDIIFCFCSWCLTDLSIDNQTYGKKTFSQKENKKKNNSRTFAVKL